MILEDLCYIFGILSYHYSKYIPFFNLNTDVTLNLVYKDEENKKQKLKRLKFQYTNNMLYIFFFFIFNKYRDDGGFTLVTILKLYKEKYINIYFNISTYTHLILEHQIETEKSVKRYNKMSKVCIYIYIDHVW